MIDESRENLVNLSGEEAFHELILFWEGKAEKASEEFVNETGEDYEQCLVDYLTSIKYTLKESQVQLITERFVNDPQFYELAHLLLACSFDGPISNITEKQKYILQSFCKHKALWSGDADLENTLSSLSLPTDKKSMEKYLHEIV